MGAWVELRATLPRRAAERGVAALVALGAGGVEEAWPEGEAPPPRQPWDRGPEPPLPERVVLRTWWPAAEAARRVEEVRAVLAPLELEALDVRAVDEQDWAEAWRRGFRRIEVEAGGRRLAVAPPWAARAGDLVIEPGLAFGTGEHPTTRRCLEAVLRHARPGGRCLDVGTGTGVLALAAARLGMEATGIDVDPEAVRAARDNARRNGLAARFSEVPPDRVPGRFELVVANIYAEVLVELAPALRARTAGVLTLAGVLADRADRVVAALAPLRVRRTARDGDWVALELAP